jgi:thioesterase domain-containing protein
MVQAWPSEEEKLALLADHLGDRQPIYGLRVPPTSVAVSLTTMRRRVNYLVRELYKLPVDPPYRLFGWSFGGTQALELGRRLGRQVDFIGMLDTWYPRYYRPSARLHYLRICVAAQQRSGPRAALGLIRAELDHDRRTLQRVSRIGKDTTLSRVGLRPPLDQFDACNWAIHRCLMFYRPKPIRQRITYFTTAETLERQRCDPIEAWAHNFAGGYEHIGLQGSHFTIWEVPHISELAGHLRRAAGAESASHGDPVTRPRPSPVSDTRRP